MKKNEEILQLAEEIMIDISNERLPLHNILLKAARLSLFLNIPANINLFKGWAKFAEQNSFIVGSFKTNMEAAKDPDISLANASSSPFANTVHHNSFERMGLRDNANKVVGYLANYRAETYNFAMGIYTKWKFGSVAEGIFEKKRNRTEPILREIFPDINQRLNSIEQNINSDNPEDWKNSVVSCRTLLIEVADILNPSKNAKEKEQYINRLKDFISPKISSKTKKKLTNTFLDELKCRIELTSNLTQGGAHKERPQKNEAEDVILFTYLAIADLVDIYSQRGKEQEFPIE
ncbi:MAG: hypothetical protein WA055_02060 [Candidatus Moraniibacteriota bacterium]